MPTVLTNMPGITSSMDWSNVVLYIHSCIFSFFCLQLLKRPSVRRSVRMYTCILRYSVRQSIIRLFICCQNVKLVHRAYLY